MRPTGAGRRARDLGRQVLGEVEERWNDRFDREAIGALRGALWDVADRFEVELPDTLPILAYGLRNRGPEPAVPRSPGREDPSRLSLPALLSRVLLSLAIDFERSSRLPIAVAADLVRVLDAEPIRVRDLPRLAGISKEAVAMALRALEETNLAEVAPDPGGSRFKVASLTGRGRTARTRARRHASRVEEEWRHRFGAPAMDALRTSLDPLVEGSPGPLLEGLRPYPDGWRAKSPIETLPQFPMVLHRGGFPDGA
jgi:DNA-binding MarR family transcriptional regulator